MLINHLLAALRNFRKNKLHTSITLLGLSLGLMTSLLAILFVIDEQDFDTFHSRLDRMYRLNKLVKEEDGSTLKTAETSGMMGPTLLTDFPEVERVVRYHPWYNPVVLTNGDRNTELAEKDILMVDSTFFSVFDFPLVRGDAKKVLTRSGTMVITESVALALFGNEDPIGKSVIGINNQTFEITGIAKETPRNSHIQFKGIVSWSSTVPNLGNIPYEWMNNWIAQGINTYVLLKPGASMEGLQAKLAGFMQTHLPERASRYSLYLQPFRDVYLDAAAIKFHGMSKTGSRAYVKVFSVIAGFILFIACVNYINISTSRATRRAKEIGMRKSLGATKGQLIRQFLGESLITTSLAALVALALVYFVIPYFNGLAGKSLPVERIWSLEALGGFVVLVLVVSLLSGLYPAFVLSAFRPAQVLKSSGQSKLSGHWPRHVLITFQFAIAIAMVAGTLLVSEQMRFVLSKDLGFDKEHILVVNLSTDMLPKASVFANEVSQHQSVVSASLGRTALGFGGASTRVQPEGFPPDEVEVRMFPVDGNFQKTYDLELTQGRFFDVPNMASDSNVVLINEALAKKLNWSNPIGKTIKRFEGDISRPVIGVLKDFYFASLYDDVEPLVMWVSPSQRNLSVRFNGNPSDLIAHIESKWKLFETRYPFKYAFVDEAFAKAYQSEEKLFQTVMTFAGLSLVIACLGLYGMVSFTLEQRIKEIGIRKVLGATVFGINVMVNRRFLALVLVAGLAAIPAIIPMMNSWLAKFAFHVDLGPGVFVTAVALTLFVTILAVSVQAIRAAMMNPVEALRME